MATLFVSCNSNPLDIKLENPPVNYDFINVDKLLNNESEDETKKNLKYLTNKLGDLLLYELSNNVQKNVTDSSFQIIHDFYQSEYIQELEREKASIDLTEQESKINKGFQYLSQHFGDSILPDQIFYINKLFSQISCSDSQIAIGLESYISPETEIIKSIPSSEFYQWQRNRMQLKYLSRDVLLAWVQVHLFHEIDGKLAEHFIQAGKILYVLNACFPKETESYVLRYSEEAFDWATKNESIVWEYIVSQQILFSSDVTTRVNFLNEGPTTVGLSQDSPDRMGQFIGYKIVKGFMNKNKSLSLQELLDTEYNNILQTYKID
ncbi:MAG: hypothetical protein WC994_07620 [Brumimicrobium sp.]